MAEENNQQTAADVDSGNWADFRSFLFKKKKKNDSDYLKMEISNGCVRKRQFVMH